MLVKEDVTRLLGPTTVDELNELEIGLELDGLVATVDAVLKLRDSEVLVRYILFDGVTAAFEVDRLFETGTELESADELNAEGRY